MLASQRNIKVLVLNTQMYSNTGGQCSKATPLGAVALFAAGGKTIAKKDLGAIAMTYGSIYVAQVAMGYSDAQTVRALAEAESYDGPSLVIAYSHCVGMGFDLSKGLRASEDGGGVGSLDLLPLRPPAGGGGQEPAADRLQGDDACRWTTSCPPRTAFNMLQKANPEAAKLLWDKAQKQACTRWQILKQQAEMTYDETCPFETGVVDEQAHAATGAKAVTGTSTGAEHARQRQPAADEDEE